MFKLFSRRSQKSNKLTVQKNRLARTLQLECLETRKLMAADVTAVFDPQSHILSITGTNGDDTIQVRNNAGRISVPSAMINVTRNGVNQQVGTIPIDQLRRVEVRTLGGNDVVAMREIGIQSSQAIGMHVWGGSGIDIIRGGSAADELHGGGAADRIFGLGGDDTIFGDAGNDRLYSGDGNDTIHGGTGNDRAVGEIGNDVIYGQDGDDWLVGCVDGDGSETGADLIYGGNGNDTIWGGAGNDRLVGEVGNDSIYGENGDDWLVGCVDGDGSEIGSDLIYGGNGNDTIWGGAGNDRLVGEVGNDTIYGEDGDDWLVGCVDWDGSETGADRIFGGRGNDTIWGGAGNDWLEGEDGNDVINGENGNDQIRGGTGNDTIDGGIGNDIITEIGLTTGELGSNYFYAIRNGVTGSDLDSITSIEIGDLTSASIIGGRTYLNASRFNGPVYLYGGEGIDTLTGSNFGDYLFAGGGNDRLWGLGGIDYLSGGAGDDFLDAGAAGEIVLGDSGQDINAYLVAVNGATADDVYQGSAPTCWVGAAIASVASKGIDLSSRITYTGFGSYVVSLWQNVPAVGTRLVNTSVYFDGSLIKNASGEDMDYLPHYSSEGDAWVTILARAYLISRNISLTNPPTGNSDDVLFALTGRANTHGGYVTIPGTGDATHDPMCASLTNADRVNIASALAQGRNVVTDSEDYVSEVAPIVVTSHLYAVVDIYDAGIGGGWYVVVRNPWGTDNNFTNDFVNDGLVTLSWADFARSFRGYTIN